MKTGLSTPQNHLIERLPRTERQRLLKLCEPVDLTAADVIRRPGEPALHAYFPVESFVSIMQQTDAYPPLEVGMVGREGMLGAELAFGVTSTPLFAVVQCSGRAWRVVRDDLLQLLLDSSALQHLLQRYVFVLMAQLSAAVACQRFHLIEARLARQLLMRQDRTNSDTLHDTHESLARMLGIRRVSVTVAAGELQRNGLIAYRRGELQVLDRMGLRAKACSCYKQDQQTYNALMTDLFKRHEI